MLHQMNGYEITDDVSKHSKNNNMAGPSDEVSVYTYPPPATFLDVFMCSTLCYTSIGEHAHIT